MSAHLSKAETSAIERVVALLYGVIARSQAVESKPKSFDTGGVLSRAEIHTVQAIGRQRGCNVKSLAQSLGVTMGAVSQMVKRLEKKGLVAKRRAPGSEKEVALDLTRLGWRGYRAHERFHAAIADAFRAYYGAALLERLPAVTAALTEVLDVVALYARIADEAGER